jgi:hypothetical protein
VNLWPNKIEALLNLERSLAEAAARADPDGHGQR